MTSWSAFHFRGRAKWQQPHAPSHGRCPLSTPAVRRAGRALSGEWARPEPAVADAVRSLGTGGKAIITNHGSGPDDCRHPSRRSRRGVVFSSVLGTSCPSD